MSPVLLWVVLIASSPAISWLRDWEAALAQARETRKPLLVRFVAMDCSAASGQPTVAAARRAGAGSSGGSRRPAGLPAPATGGVALEMDDCRRMEEDVWSRPDVAEAAGRYLAVIGEDQGDRRLLRRYEVATFPTTLVADPWGNEIIRLVNYVPRERFLRIIAALPADFSALEPAARQLAANPHDPLALERAAGFYESARLPEIAERYYERALASELARSDALLRVRLSVARGTNLLRLGKPDEAAAVFRRAFGDSPEAASDLLLFGWMMAELQQGRRPEAERPFHELVRRFPASRYTARARENMAAAAQPPR